MRLGSFIMTVAHLLTLMGHLSLGNDNINATERAIFLQYLNLAHFELYQVTATLNQDLYTKEEINKPANVGLIDLPEKPFVMGGVSVPSLRTTLKKISIQRALEMDPEFKQPGPLTSYVLKKNTILLVPYQSMPLDVVVWYIPEVVSLTEDTQESNIPYPLAYHPVLVDGALYYLFQEEGGFKNTQKAQEAEQLWEMGQSRLLSYLYNASGETLSTFMNV